MSQTVVHIDCDAFYAAVEELDRPDLKDLPFAVGKGVLTTCNYHARKFGCRSGMAGFVARKLCPQLICLPMNFEKYTAKAMEVRSVLANYDPRFESASIDEAYMNITQYCEEHQMDPEDVMQQLRREVHEKAKITVSAGIAANAKIAKICSNYNKPNGQFRVASDRTAIMSFMAQLPTRKVNGIGRVFERELDAIGIKTCGDIYDHRAYLAKLFGEKAYQFLIQCYLGLGRTRVQPAEEYERKSVGTESTFSDVSDKTELRSKLRHTAEELEKDLARTQFKSKTLVLKVKLHTYEVFTRQVVTPKPVNLADDLYKYSEPMLSKLEQETPSFRLRLMGLRCTNLISTKKPNMIDFFGAAAQSNPESTSSHTKSTNSTSDGEWEVWPDTEFEAAALLEKQEEMNEIEQLSQEALQSESSTSLSSSETKNKPPPSPEFRHGKVILPNPAPEMSSSTASSEPIALPWTCPICSRPQRADDRAFNEHIDLCLSRQAIKEAVRESPRPEQEKESEKERETTPLSGNVSVVGKRKFVSREGSRDDARGNGSRQKRLFFQ